MALDQYGLTPKQKAFCDLYIQYGNASRAAKEAGYKNPKISAEDNMEKHACKEYIAMRMKPTEDKRIADADEVLLMLSEIARGNIKDQFGLDASLQDRIKAMQELMKRYAVADMRQQSTMQRLDSLFVEFRAALAEPESKAIEAPKPTQTAVDIEEQAEEQKPTNDA